MNIRPYKNKLAGNRGRVQRHRRGSVLIWMAMLIVLLLAMIALAVDFAYVHYVQAQLDAAVDSAALAAASGLSLGEDAARNRAQVYAAKNSIDGEALILSDSDIQIGAWDSTTRAFTNGSGINVSAAVTVSRNREVDYFFAGILGFHSTNVDASATAVFQSRDIILVLDYSASMNDDSELGHASTLGLDEIEKNLYDIWVDLGEPEYGLMQFEPVTINSNNANIKTILGLNGVPYPYPSGSWDEYIAYVKSEKTLRDTGYDDKYGYLTLINYWLTEQPEASQTPDLWKTSEQPITAVKDAVTIFLNYLRQVNTFDQVGLAAYTSEDGEAVLEVPLTKNLSWVELISRQRQAGHYNLYTNIAAGIEVARNELLFSARPATLQMIVLLSDGKANWHNNSYNPGQARKETLAQANLAAEERFPIVTISLGADSDADLMRQVADITGGIHYHISGGDDVADTEEALNNVFRDIAAHRALRLVH